MQPYRKSFAGDPLFPFEIVYKTIKHPDKELPDHLHDHYELVYVHSGQGIFFIDNCWYQKSAGDLFVIPGNTIHHSLPDLEDPIVSSAIFFAPTLIAGPSLGDGYFSLQCYEIARKKKRFKIGLAGSLRIAAEMAIKQIAEEFANQETGYREAVLLTIGQLLLQINRHLLTDEITQHESPRIGPSWILRALKRIDEHPEREIHLTDLAREACVSPSHFSRVFRQLTSLNVIGYVNTKRIIKAKELLLFSDENVNVIAEKCGYETPAHFYRVFKSLTGETPGQYRNRSQAVMPRRRLPERK